MAGKVVIDSIENGVGEVGSTTDMIKGSARAWCVFDGTSSNLTSTMTGYNVSSIIDNGTGNYTAIFITPMDDMNFCAVSSTGSDSYNVGTYMLSTSTCRMMVAVPVQYNIDSTRMSLAVFR